MNDVCLRILQVSASDRMGGAERIARGLHEGFRAVGHQSWMAVGTKTTYDRDLYVLDHDRRRSARAWAFRGLAHALEPVASVRGAKRVQLLFRDALGQPQRTAARNRGEEDFDFPATADCLSLPPERPEILHLHNLHSPAGYFDLRELPALSAKVPTFITLHDAWLLSGHCAHSFDCERWVSGCGACPDLSIYPPIQKDATAFNWERKREILARCKLRVITPSQWLMDRVARSILQPAAVESAVIPNGVDLSIFRPGSRSLARASLCLPQDATILLFAANGIRSNPFKDFQTLRAALPRVAERFGEGKLILLALGEDCPDEQIGAATIRFVPFQPDERVVAQYYHAADVYLHPARADTFPTSVLEAMACGRPVVASRVGGIPEQITEGETGFLSDVGDARGMADAILALLGDAERRQAMGDWAAEVARDQYGIERQVASVLGWYRRVLGR